MTTPETETVKIEAIKRFNHHDPGDEFETIFENAKVWIREGLAREAQDDPDDELKTAKSPGGPPSDKAVKSPTVKK